MSRANEKRNVTDSEHGFRDNSTSPVYLNLAAKALNEFRKRNYVQSLHTLQRIGDLKNENNELKIFHNKAVVEFYKSDLKNIQKMQVSLKTYFAKAKIEISTFHNADHCLPFLNQAILYYYLNEESAALEIVERLLFFTESMEYKTSIILYLLALELYSITQQPTKGLELVAVIDSFLSSEPQDRRADANKQIKDFLKSQSIKYSIQFHLHLHNIEAANREMAKIHDKQDVKCLCLRALKELKIGNHEKSMHLLTSVIHPTSKAALLQNVISFNNQAVINMKLGRWEAARVAIDAALRYNFRQREKKGFYEMGLCKTQELLFNRGLILLKLGHFAQAFDCFKEAVKKFHRNARLWLRLTECAVRVDQIKDAEQTEIVEKGRGKHRKLILPGQKSNDHRFSFKVQSYAIPEPTLGFALICIRNALQLIESDNENAIDLSPVNIVSTHTGNIEVPATFTANCSPSPPFTAAEHDDLYNAILLMHAFVNLKLSNFIVVKEKIDVLLKRPRLTPAQKLVANIYAANALVMLDRANEALKYLSPEQFKNQNIDFVKSLNLSAHSLMRFNLSVAFALKYDFNSATNTLTKLIKDLNSSKSVVPTQLLILSAYLKIRAGDIKNGKVLLEKAFASQKSE